MTTEGHLSQSCSDIIEEPREVDCSETTEDDTGAIVVCLYAPFLRILNYTVYHYVTKPELLLVTGISILQ